MFTLGQEHILEEASKPQAVMFTAGAVPIINKKGEVSMEKVHVKRYVAGKRPDWASDGESSSDDEVQLKKQVEKSAEEGAEEANLEHIYATGNDRRLLRLRQHLDTNIDIDEKLRRRRTHEEEVEVSEEVEKEEVEVEEKMEVERPSRVTAPAIGDESSDEDELDDEEIERRREQLRLRARERVNQEEELLALPEPLEEETNQVEEEEFTTTDEDFSESDDEGEGQRLKPVFVRKKDRRTIQEREKEEERQRELAEEAKKLAEERRKDTIRIIELETRAEIESRVVVDSQSALEVALQSVDSDDANDEAEYEGWKLRELKRVKRDREEREMKQKEREEVERLNAMTPEEREAALRNNPRKVTNEKAKGKYKFLQKYYHRGAFFMEKDEDIYSRNFAEPTLDDHFDKTILPKVMQVKNFGRSGRTKYTHLVDQDTTNFDSPWAVDSASSSKFMEERGGGMRQVFARPSNTKRKPANQKPQ